jgi:hypothetical protein
LIAAWSDRLQIADFVGVRLSLPQRLRMGLAQVVFLFPTDSKKNEIVETERPVASGLPPLSPTD